MTFEKFKAAASIAAANIVHSPALSQLSKQSDTNSLPTCLYYTKLLNKKILKYVEKTV